MENNIEEVIVDKLKNSKSEKLINIMRKMKVSDSVIMLTLLGIGTHAEYYKVLYNKINNYKEEINDNSIKKMASEIFHEIDRNDSKE